MLKAETNQSTNYRPSKPMTINDFRKNFTEYVESCIPKPKPKTDSLVKDVEDILNHMRTTYSKLRMKY